MFWSGETLLLGGTETQYTAARLRRCPADETRPRATTTKRKDTGHWQSGRRGPRPSQLVARVQQEQEDAQLYE